MSLSRHACRHALKPPTTPTFDHLWISDELLAAIFRRFVNGQRRHGSCVPGPLEARRRLAKRRNTGLAGIGAGSAQDIACLFGRNGTEHMKWTDQSSRRAQLGAPDLIDYPARPPDVPFLLSDQAPDLSDPFILPHNPPNSPETDGATHNQLLEEFPATNHWGIEDARGFIRRWKIDLQQQPEYSQRIFQKLLARSTEDFTEAIAFLNDPFLNIRGSGNYYAAVEVFVRLKSYASARTDLLNAVNRALELGQIPTDELSLIIKAIPHIISERGKTLGKAEPPSGMVRYYRNMWEAIGCCKILGHRDLETGVIDSWLEELLKAKSFRFAEQIILESHDAHPGSLWPSILLEKWLEAMEEGLGSQKIPFSPENLLNQLDANCAADCIIRVTESLVFSSRSKRQRNRLLIRWRDYLSKLLNVSAIAESRIWVDLPRDFVQPSSENALPLDNFIQRQIILRVWVLRTLCRSLGPMYNQIPKATDVPIYLLLNLYEMNTRNSTGSFLGDLMQGIHDLNLPHNHLLSLAVDLKLRKSMRADTRNVLWQLESFQVSLADVFADVHSYRRIRSLFFGTFEQMFRRIDPTSPEFVQNYLRLARRGDPTSLWRIIHFLNNHTPLKICLNRAWTPLPDPDEKALVRYHPNPRNSECPDPYAAADLIHQLAIAFSCCRRLTPPQAFRHVHWLYDYLRKHGGPVYPSLPQAMYHAGVIRYRREGLRVAPTQYKYILWIISKFEQRKVARKLRASSRIKEELRDYQKYAS